MALCVSQGSPERKNQKAFGFCAYKNLLEGIDLHDHEKFHDLTFANISMPQTLSVFFLECQF